MGSFYIKTERKYLLRKRSCKKSFFRLMTLMRHIEYLYLVLTPTCQKGGGGTEKILRVCPADYNTELAIVCVRMVGVWGGV